MGGSNTGDSVVIETLKHSWNRLEAQVAPTSCFEVFRAPGQPEDPSALPRLRSPPYVNYDTGMLMIII